MAKPWSIIPAASPRWRPSGSTRRSWCAGARGADKSSQPRSSTWVRGQLLNVVPGRSGTEPVAWLAAGQGVVCEGALRHLGSLGSLSQGVHADDAPSRPGGRSVPSLRLANAKLDERRRRVQIETLGHRGPRQIPSIAAGACSPRQRKDTTKAAGAKLVGLLRAGDPHGDVATMWQAKEAVRELYAHGDPDLALDWVTQLSRDLQGRDYPLEARSLGRTLVNWRHEIAAWHHAHVSNRPTEAANNPIKRVKRVAFGLREFRNYRVQGLLYAGKPDWSLLATISLADLRTPRMGDLREPRTSGARCVRTAPAAYFPRQMQWSPEHRQALTINATRLVGCGSCATGRALCDAIASLDPDPQSRLVFVDAEHTRLGEADHHRRHAIGVSLRVPFHVRRVEDGVSRGVSSSSDLAGSPLQIRRARKDLGFFGDKPVRAGLRGAVLPTEVCAATR